MMARVPASLVGLLTAVLVAACQPRASGPEDIVGVPSPIPSTIRVEAGDIASTLVLDATVVASPRWSVVAPTRGRLAVASVAGSYADEPLQIGTITGRGGIVHTLVLPAHSRLDAWMSQEGDEVPEGLPLAVATYSGFALQATIPPETFSSFAGAPISAKGQILKGPGPSSCPILGAIGLPAVVEPGLDGNYPHLDSAAEPVVTCALPRDLTLMTGMRGLLAMLTASVRGVPVLPSAAVAGDAQRGSVYLALPDGTVKLRDVELGISDGDRIQIKSGLEVGDLVALPAPDLDPSASR